MRFSDASLRALPTPETGQKLYSDDSLPGFGLRVSPKTKTFVLTYGKQRERITIGRYPIISLAQARGRARTILAERQLGVVRKRTPTFSVVREEYLARRDREVRFSTRQADGYLFHLFDSLAERRLSDITPPLLDDTLSAMPRHTTRRHAFIRLQGLFRFAIMRDYIERSPLEKLQCPEDVEPRERVLSDDELRAVFRAAQAYPHIYGSLIELCAVSGQRRNQIGSLNASHVDWNARTIEWPPELMKTGKRHLIPFGDLSEQILKRQTPNRYGFYFPSQTGGGFVGWSYHKEHFDKLCGVTFRVHDLRRTLATRWQELGVEIACTERYLSHSAVTGGLVGIYQRASYLEPMRKAVQAWEEHLRALLDKRRAA